MKHLRFCCFVVDLKIFFDNMICSWCQMDLQFKDAIRVYPSGISRYLIVRCKFCYTIVRVGMGKVHRREGASRGVKAFDANTKLSTDEVFNGHTFII